MPIYVSYIYYFNQEIQKGRKTQCNYTVGIFLEKLPLVPWSEMYRKYGPLVKETVGGKTILHVFNLGKELLSLPLVLQIFLNILKTCGLCCDSSLAHRTLTLWILLITVNKINDKDKDIYLHT